MKTGKDPSNPLQAPREVTVVLLIFPSLPFIFSLFSSCLQSLNGKILDITKPSNYFIICSSTFLSSDWTGKLVVVGAKAMVISEETEREGITVEEDRAMQTGHNPQIAPGTYSQLGGQGCRVCRQILKWDFLVSTPCITCIYLFVILQGPSQVSTSCLPVHTGQNALYSVRYLQPQGNGSQAKNAVHLALCQPPPPPPPVFAKPHASC